MTREIKKVVLLGANGTMGYGSGALFTRAGCQVAFLARTKEKAQAGLDSAISQVRSPSVASKVTVGSYDEDLEREVKDADLIFEAVAEDFKIKNEIFNRVDKVRQEGSIIATVSSGLSITKLAENQSESFRKNFLGLHYFNPANVIVGTEIIPSKYTDPKIVEFLMEWCERTQTRAMVKTADTPAFAGNRVGFKVLNEVAQLAEEHGPVLMDYLIGPYTGRALSPLSTIDLVGFDVHKAIVDNVVANVTPEQDEALETYKLPAYMQALVEKGVLGRKTKGGFFKRVNRVPYYLDIKSGEYKPVADYTLPKLDFIEKMKKLQRIAKYKDAMSVFVNAEGPEAEIAQKVIGGYISYSFHRAGEVTEDISGIDLIMGAGFNWAPPSVLVDLIGVKQTIAMLEKVGVAVPQILKDADESTTFFKHPFLNVGKFFVAK
ncbi:MAG: 3-hydroxyacyl-CoA dehydrogenase [bacterium]|jgi:3-hydroxyacyl-CoA dehydrogenase